MFIDNDDDDTRMTDGKSLFEMESWREEEGKPEDAPEVTEPEKVIDDAGEAESGKEVSDAPDGEEGKPQYYTVEELRELAEEPDGLDTTRIPPELQAVYKSFQKGYGRKFEKLAEERKRLEAEKAKQPEKQPEPETTDIYSVYNRDPKKVERAIADEILKLEDTDPLDENYRPNRKRIRELENLREDLRDQHKKVEEKQRSVDSITERVMSEVRKIPEFETRKDSLEDIAIQYGLTRQDLALITNPRISGEVAGRFIKMLNGIYEERATHSKDTLKKKEVKPEPTKVEGAGGGKTPKQETQWSENDYFAMRAKQIL